MRRPSRRLAWPIAATSMLMMATSLMFDPLLTTGRAQTDLLSTEALLYLAFLCFPVLGGITASRYPENALAWVFVGIGVILGMLALSDGYLHFASPIGSRPSGAELVAAWAGNWTWVAVVGVIPIYIPLLFPNGKLLSPRWRSVAWFGGVAIATLAVDLMFADRIQGDGYEFSNPVGISFLGSEARFEIVFLAMGAAGILSVVSFGIRFFRSRGAERQQMKWLLLSLAVLVISMVVLQWVPTSPEWIFPIAVFSVPVSIGIAMLRYRLYDIDVVINRALVYGSLSAILGGFYVGIVFALQALLAPVTAESDLAVAGSTLAVAALFGPVRRRVQEFIDRRFYRRKFDSQQTVEEFNSHLRDEVDLTEISNRFVDVVLRTMQPAHASLWLRGVER